MPTIQHDNDYGARTIGRVLILITSLMFIGFLVFLNKDDRGAMALLSVVGGSILIFGIVWLAQVQESYHCSKCGAILPLVEPNASTQFQHRFHCQDCDITWTTDIYEGNDD